MTGEHRHTRPRAFGPQIPVDTCVAVALGLNEAIVLQQLRYLIGTAEGNPRHTFEGRVWVWNTYGQWATEQIPFLSAQTIKRAMCSLESKGIVLSRQRNSYNRTKLYSVDEEALARTVGSSAEATAFDASHRQRSAKPSPSAQVEPLEGVSLGPSNGRGRPVDGEDESPSFHRVPESTSNTTQENEGGVHRDRVTRTNGGQP
jgi:hypothetical protein